MLANVLGLQKVKLIRVVTPFHFVKRLINVDYTLKANYFIFSRTKIAFLPKVLEQFHNNLISKTTKKKQKSTSWFVFMDGVCLCQGCRATTPDLYKFSAFIC